MEFNNNKKIIQNIFLSHATKLKNTKHPLKDLKALDAIMHCRTVEQGYTILSCPDKHEDKIQTHSCKHRSCPICADKARLNWIDSQKKRLLDCEHFHIVFTIPHEYLNLWQYNRKWFTGVFFKACRDTLMELSQDKKYLDAMPGILMTLHTWGRQLNYHPHIHCLVTSGGINKSNKWKPLKGDYILPIRVVKKLFRGKLQAFIKEGLITEKAHPPKGVTLFEALKTHRDVYKKEWSVRIQEKYEHGKGVVLYLARYMKGGPINPKQIISCDSHVKFLYKDHRDQKTKELSLKTDEFIRRILWHVPEIGIHVVRHYGLYSSNNKKKRNICREVTGGISENANSAGNDKEDTLNWTCRVCGMQLQRAFTTYQTAHYENSLLKRAVPAHVQQNVKADLEPTIRLRINRPCRI